MSHRAIQRLRQEREADLPPEEESDEQSFDEEPAKKSGFAFMMNDSDDASSSSSSSSEEDATPAEEETTIEASKDNTPPVEEEPKEPEDLDALLEEFMEKDEGLAGNTEDNDNDTVAKYYAIVTSPMETRDLDIDYVMRTSLLGSTEDSNPRGSRRGRQACIFGPPRDNWPRPPHYVGGGIGMSNYVTEEQSPDLPWPYSDMKEGDERCPSLDRWFKFKYSDSYQRDLSDFEIVKGSGDPNALAMFIAHHPFVVEALLQMVTVLYQTNQSQEGLSLLKRALYVYECACPNSFLKVEAHHGFMDFEQPTNALLFSALFRMIQVSHVAGLPRASLAVSRFLLALDPLRDPMGVLLAMDYFALQSNMESNDQWLIDFVESQKIAVMYKDDTNEDGYDGDLLDLPNWAYSYALALYRCNLNAPSENSQDRADKAIQSALRRFPSVWEQLLIKNEINTSARSFQVDWSSVLDFLRAHTTEMESNISDAAAKDPVVRSCSAQSYDLIVRIFVQLSHKLWSFDTVLKWIYQNLAVVKDSSSSSDPAPLSPAIMRYARCDPSDYEDKFQTMPADANPLDPNLVAHAMNVDTSRPRFMQRARGGAGGFPDELERHLQGRVIAGPPTEMIDPDWPMLEVFWRSFMPWAHVEGMPPPNR